MLLLLLLCLLLLALALHSKGSRNPRCQLPPGPTPLPLLGNLLQLGPSSLDKRLMKLSKSFGSVFTVYLGPQPAVVLSGASTLREALLLQADAFSGRGGMASFDRCTQGKGIVFSNGHLWHTLRTFTVGSLKKLGIGSRSIAERIQEEAAALIQELSLIQGASFDPLSHIRNAVANVICSVVFGERYAYDDPDFRILLNLLNDNFQILSSQWGQMYNIFPSFLDWIPGPHHRIFSNFNKLQAFISKEIKKHEENRQPEEPQNFIDCFLDQMDKAKQDPRSHFYMETLVMTTHNLFFGGTETTSTTIHYGLLILLKYPNVTEKIQEEIDTVVGRDRLPCLQDRDNLPYTNAVIHEIQRFISVLPMGLPHILTQDTHFRGHFLLKGTTILPLLISAHRDPTQFKDPENFNPNNFLDDKGAFQNNDAFMPFALGKRICLGAGLARMEIFLFLTTILQRFTLCTVKRPEEIDLSPKSTGLGNVSPPYELLLKIR
ncbi:cytochrome P450 2F2-like isoform X2 [Phascolarctos cinereus]|uniref:Cytochrome P450 2F2-like isoform X2 n=1 Tax=Phascolarctos cinereus TaxID=38626 RepID=A0A6P5JVA8_PHACI|nr:cytochrome P450 2F2-like isoform X2 [Phascolarctos cinereus]